MSRLSLLALLPLALTGACDPDPSDPGGSVPLDPGDAQDSGADEGGGGLDSETGEGDTSDGETGDDTGADSGGGDSGGGDSGGDSGGGDTGGSDTGGDSGGGDSGGGSSSGALHFVVLGDGGTGRSEQYAVAAAVEAVCARNPCEFALYLGDNFYSDGVASVDDSQWQEKFELPYQHLDFPFWAALGNHDYGDGGGGFEEARAQAEVDYSATSDKWNMPAKYYSHVHGDVSFFALDTTALDWGYTDEQDAWLPDDLAGANTPWKIAYGHHPYVSNGPHGNANDAMGGFVERNLCGQVDVYFNGHDHSLQWLEPTCGTEFIISGAAAKSSEVGHGNWPSHFEQEGNGFLWVEIDGDTFTGVFYDADATELYRRTFTRTAG